MVFGFCGVFGSDCIRCVVVGLLVGSLYDSIGSYVYIFIFVCVFNCYDMCENRFVCIGMCWFGKYMVFIVLLFFGLVNVCRYIICGVRFLMWLISLLRLVFCCFGFGL